MSEDALPDNVRRVLDAWLPAGEHGSTEHLEPFEEEAPGSLYYCGPAEHLEQDEEEP